MKDTIRKLLAATHPSRELDEDIAIAAGIWRPWLSKHRRWNFEPAPELERKSFSWPYNPIPNYDEDTGEKIELAQMPPHGWAWEADLPNYTESIDGACKLLRPHYRFELKKGIGCRAIVWWLEKDWEDTGAPTASNAEYPALALATATLIARVVEDRKLDLYDDLKQGE